MDYLSALLVYLEENYDKSREFFSSKKIEAYFRKMRERYPYFCIFGAGSLGKTVCRYLLENDISVDFFCDNNMEKDGIEEEVNGRRIPCISHFQLEKLKNQVFIIVAAADKIIRYNLQINQQIKHIGSVLKSPLALERVLITSLDMEKDTLFQKVKELFGVLADEKSKEIVYQLLKYRISDKIEYDNMDSLYACYDSHQYLPKDILQLKKDEIIIDCGAYTGDSLAEFLKVRKDFAQWHCFEMDAYIREKLKNYVNGLEESIREKVLIHPYGISDRKKTINYTSDITGGSKIVSGGNSGETVVGLDEFFGQKDITYIKMDIENAELDALRGAKNIIQGQQPVLAISMYHSLEQFLEIPVYIKQICPLYKIYIRHHTTLLDDTVCYAILQ